MPLRDPRACSPFLICSLPQGEWIQGANRQLLSYRLRHCEHGGVEGGRGSRERVLSVVWPALLGSSLIDGLALLDAPAPVPSLASGTWFARAVNKGEEEIAQMQAGGVMEDYARGGIVEGGWGVEGGGFRERQLRDAVLGAAWHWEDRYEFVTCLGCVCLVFICGALDCTGRIGMRG